MSARIVVPPSPNWYNSNTLDCYANSGVVAYAASKSLVCIWPNQEKGVGFPRVVVISDAHNSKITGVSWSQTSKDRLLLSSCSEDGLVCVWNVEDKALILSHEKHQQKVNSISWSAADGKYIASSSEDGAVILMELMLEYSTYTTKRIEIGGKINPLLVSMNPHISWMLVVGCKGGLLYVVDTRVTRGIVHKFRAHEEDVLGVAWSLNPRSFDVGGMLATTGRDKMIKIWSPTEGKCISQSKLPSNTGIHRPKSDFDKRSIWVALNWTESNQILTSGLSGELISWDVSLKKWKIEHKLHGRGLFNIGSFQKNGQVMVWTAAQDRNLFLWPLELEHHKSKEILGVPEMESPWLCVPTLGGFVYSISINPVDSSHAAIGVGDGTIRLWNVAAPTFDMTTIWNGIKGKVTSVSWHPSIEGRLAFGTDEGRVGIFDTLCPSKGPILSRTHHKGTVYTLTWGPSVTLEHETVLYSCGGGHIFIHNPSAADSEAVNLNKLIDSGNGKFAPRTELGWKADSSLLAVGNEDGSVELYSIRAGKLHPMAVMVAHKKLIQSLKWHPQFTFQSPDQSLFHHWLAVSSSDSHVKVFAIDANSEDRVTSSLVATLTGHKERIVSMAWNPHQDRFLLTASYDGTAQVWNVGDQTPVANFGGHSGRVLVCEWDALEPNVAVSGGDDFTVRIWNWKEQVHKNPAGSLADRPVKEERKKAGTHAPKPAQPAAVVKKKLSKLKSLFPVGSALEGRGKNRTLEDCKILAALNQIPLEHSTRPEAPTPLEWLGTGPWTNLGFFGDGRSTDRMLATEIGHHVTESNLDLAIQLQVWRGSAEQLIREAVRTQQLNDWIVALSPQISLEFWREICQCYSKQLIDAGDVRKAVSYLISAGLRDEAARVLANHQLHREATALTRCTSSDQDAIKERLSQWAAKATLDSNFEMAAKCHLSIGQNEEAARVLARRANADALKLAADLARHCQLDQLAEAYVNEAAEKERLAREDAPVTETQEDGAANLTSDRETGTGSFNPELE